MTEQLKEEVENGNPVSEDGNMWTDLMGAALSEVDWREIATHLVDAAMEQKATT